MRDVFLDAASVVPMPRTAAGAADEQEFWRTDDPHISSTRAVLRGGMWPAQREWWNLPNFIRALVGGYGAGKTMILGKRMIAVSLQNAPAPSAIVSPTFPTARETVVPTIVEQLSGKQSIYGRDFWWEYHKRIHTFQIRFRGRNARIIIYSGEDPLSLRGPNLGAAGIDEPFIQDREVFDQMIARVRHPLAKKLELNMTGTPEQLNWGYDICAGELKDKYDVGVVTAGTNQNRALDPSYTDRLRAVLSEKAAQAYVEGKFVSLADGMVYYGFDPQENVVAIERPEGSELGAGMDFNVDPMSAAVFWRRGDHIHFFDEIEAPNADTEFMCQELLERYPDLRKIYPDATGVRRHTNAPGGKSDFTYIERAGLTVMANTRNPLRKDRYNAVNGKLRPAHGRVTLTIDPKCKKLRKYLSIYSHKLMPRQEAMSHLLDAFSYPIAYLFPVDKDTLRRIRIGGL